MNSLNIESKSTLRQTSSHPKRRVYALGLVRFKMSQSRSTLDEEQENIRVLGLMVFEEDKSETTDI